jgi:hypothetical protein
MATAGTGTFGSCATRTGARVPDDAKLAHNKSAEINARARAKVIWSAEARRDSFCLFFMGMELRLTAKSFRQR